MGKTATAACYFGTFATMVTAACIELKMGRSLLCPCGTIHLWVGSIKSAELSQQIADAYSFSHLIHGFCLYGIFYLLGRKREWSFSWRLLLTAVVEAGWEILENSPIIINRYRQTAAQGYAGDSVLNSMSDITFCLIGFAIARQLPVWVTVTLIALMELGVGYAIHDNLVLNIIMLIHPFAGIKHWQSAV